MDKILKREILAKFIKGRMDEENGGVELGTFQKGLAENSVGVQKEIARLKDILETKQNLETESGPKGLMGQLFNFSGIASDTGPMSGKYLRASTNYDSEGNELPAGYISRAANYFFPDEMEKRKAFEQKVIRRGASLMSSTNPDSTGSQLTAGEKAERFPEWPSMLDQDNIIKTSAREGISAREKALSVLREQLKATDPNSRVFSDFVNTLTRGE